MNIPFEKYRDLINTYLDRHLPDEEAPPVPIYRAMRYSLFAGGKRLRPMLVLMTGETLACDLELLLPIAASVEMIHTYSLIHDDLPSMDNDDFRRGKPTNHKVFGEALAILAGDALLTGGMEFLAKAPYDPEIRCVLLQQLTAAAGTNGMIGGQVLDIISESRILNQIELEKIHAMKTAALIAFCATAPAILLQKPAAVRQAFWNYGEAIGLAFQIIDDILDVEGTTQSLGKTAGKDSHAGKATYPALLGLEESRNLAASLIDSACKTIADFDSHGFLHSFAVYILKRKQ